MKVFISLLVLFFVLFYSCDRRSENNIDLKHGNNVLFVRKSILTKFAQFKSQVKDETSEYYSIEVINEDYNSVFTEEDTIVIISILNCLNIKNDEYRGVVQLKGNKIVVFDKKNLSNKYFLNNELFYIPIGDLECSNEKIIKALVLKFKHGVLKEWN